MSLKLSIELNRNIDIPLKKILLCFLLYEKRIGLEFIKKKIVKSLSKKKFVNLFSLKCMFICCSLRSDPNSAS